MAMPSTPTELWQQLTPEQQARIIAVLVQMLVGHLTPSEVADDAQ